MSYYLSLLFFFIEVKGADHVIDIGIVIDRVVREDPFQDHRIKIRRITGKICLTLRSNEKIRRNQKMLYL